MPLHHSTASKSTTLPYKLRCQIARICACTAITSRGVYSVRPSETEGEEPEIERVETPEPRALSFYWQRENWLHLEPTILRQGRVTAEQIEFDDTVDEAVRPEIKQQVRQRDPAEPRLKPLLEDKHPSLPTCWTFKLVGEKVEYVDAYSQKRSSDTTLVIRSLLWPGFHFFFKDEQSFGVYIGDGQKYSAQPYFPQFHAQMQAEPNPLAVSTEKAVPPPEPPAEEAQPQA